jgi:RNA polymerase sigma-70 factor (ECF subfamily)
MNERVATMDTPSRVDPYEADLVGRAKARSPAAWTEIYQSHYGAIFRYIKARVFDEATAEDLAASVFVGALKGIASYRYRGRPLLAWLYRIARNVVASYQRETLTQQEGSGLTRRLVDRLMRRSQSGASHDEGHDDVAAPGSESDPATMIDRLDLRSAIARLPANQREVVILRFIVGLSAQEVAAVMEKGTAAVYSLQARAILALREHLK